MADKIMYPEEEAALKKVFRRSSFEFGFIRASSMLSILHSMGQQKVDEAELARWIANLDHMNTGTLGYEEYTTICKHFLKDPIAVQRSESDEFSFKHLIRMADFAHV